LREQGQTNALNGKPVLFQNCKGSPLAWSRRDLDFAGHFARFIDDAHTGLFH
jgi:hypothetical protein